MHDEHIIWRMGICKIGGFKIEPTLLAAAQMQALQLLQQSALNQGINLILTSVVLGLNAAANGLDFGAIGGFAGASELSS